MVGRETFRNLGERVRNAMNIRRAGGGYTNLARSGRNPHHARAISASRSTTAWAIAVVVAMIAAVTVMFIPSPAAQAADNTVVDPDTTNNWTQVADPEGQASTQNIGRIWTDKSVFDEDYAFQGQLSGSVGKGKSDFLVGLSALSSTSNLTETTTTSTPLDIVLVLDTSGSMDNDMGEAGWVESYDAVNPQDVRISHGEMQTRTYWEWFQQHEYQAAVQLTRGGEYYVKVGDEYVRVNEVTHTVNGERNTSYEEHDAWRVNGQDVDPSTTTFYEHNRQWQDAPTKMDALQEAADAFINNVASMNDDIADANQQHRIALVKFASDNSNSIGNDFTRAGYNYSQIVSGLQAYTSANASTLTDTVDGLRPTGATQADYGLAQAERALNGAGSTARPNAKKVVIFFTDGNPTSGSSWEGSVAADAINNAHDLKEAGVAVYSIGVFDGANPSDTSGNFNKYMNAVSSNYPDAECANWRGQQTDDFDDLDLGNRASSDDPDEPAPQYYFSAENSEQLDQVFEDITSSMTENTGSGSPIQSTTQAGAHETPGNLTFTDQLGSYMEVTGTGEGTDNKMQLAYADQLYTSTSRDERQIQGGTVYTYQFEGQVAGNAVYGAANLSDITVEVTHYNDAAQGDLVQVTIPASLIPLRNYGVNADNNTMTVSEAYPIRLFYGVSLKQAAKDAIAAGSGNVYDAIAKNNVSADKQNVDFYTNLYTNGNGDTTATFTPNEANKFYYYTSDTPLYTDEGCTQRATRWDIQSGDTVYYQDTYYVQNGTGYTQQTESVAVSSDGSEYAQIETDRQGNAYMPAHTQRTDRPGTLNTDKSENKTGTAATALVPSWSGANEVTQALGNNGKMSYPMPGSLEIKKSIDWTNASDQTKRGKNQFTFEVQLTDEDGNAVSGTYKYFTNGGEDPAGEVTFDGDGKATVTVTTLGGASQYGTGNLVIEGLPSGTKFTVSEQNINQNGFTLTRDATSQEGVGNSNTTDGSVTGTVQPGSQVSLSFDNRYRAQDVNLNSKATLQVKKNLTGRDWRDTDEFTFAIDGLAGPNGTAAPEPAETTIKVDDETTDYTKAFGDITFTQPGEYRYAVTEVSDGIQTIPGIDYSAARYRVVVNVSDNSTGNLVVDSVTIEQRLDDEGHTPQSQPTIDNNTMVFTNNYNLDAATTNIDGTKNYTDTTGKNPINADKFTFQLKALGGYETEGGSADHYTVDAADVPMPDTADENHAVTTNNTGYGFGFPTISYNGNAVGKTFVYEVSELKGDEQGMTYDENTKYTVKVAVSEIDDPENPGQKIIVATPDLDPQNIVFKNTYDPADAKLEGNDAIHGTKTLTGRDMKEDETFYFQLTQTGGPATLDPNDGDAYVQVLNAPEYATVSQGDQDMAFNFRDMTFSVAGTYTFQVNEVANQNGDETTDGSGLIYDQNVCTVTVEVKDNHNGTMTATASYANQGHSETDKAVFDNTYTASMNYGANGAGGINVTKQMLDRPMAEGDFNFTITPKGEDKAYETFTNTAAEKNGTVTMKQLQNLTFDQDDAGKTFTYIVDESDPVSDKVLPEVDYDQSQYKVEIQVVDNGDGTMHAVTTVTKIKNAKGESDNEVVVDHADSSADGYTAPTFGFVNDYNPNGTTAGGEDAEHPLQVTKTVEGAPSPEDVTYTFTLTPAEDYGTKVTGLTDGKLTAHTTGSIAKGESQTVNFGQLTFTEPGTYTFDVQEDQPATDDGWTFDDADGNGQTDQHQITVVVTDLNDEGAYDGNLYIQSVTGSPAQVTNSYHANEVTVGGEGADQQIDVQKTVTGADSDENFQFKLEPIVDETNTQEVWANNVEPAEGNDGTVTIDGGVKQEKAGTATFGGITFKAEGTYKFNVTEVQAHDGVDDPAGWTYDTHTSVVTVTVTDEGNDGQLDAAVSYDNSAATTDADKGCTTAAAFTNSYSPDEVTTTDDTSVDTNIKVTKSVTGARATEAFTFELQKAKGQDYSNVFEGTGDEKTPFDGVEVSTSDSIAAGDTETKAFSGVTFTKAGDYKFVIDETTTTDKAGWTYDGSTHEITVHVADQDAKLVITGIDGNNPTFTNKYVPNEVTTDGKNGLDNLQVTKAVTGAPATSDFEFSLKLIQGEINNVKLGSGETATAFPADGITTKTTDLTGKEGDAAKQTVSFGDMSFTATGTYTFEVAEATTTTADGWTYDNEPKTITVEVTDEGFDGQLDAKVTGDNPTITNSYHAGSVTVGEGEASGPIQVTKKIEGTAPAAEDFSFELAFDADAEGNTGEAENIEGLTDGKLTTTVSKDSLAEDNTETVSFGKLTFKAEGEYYFTVTETTKAAENSGWTYDNTAKTVVVSVTDKNHDGYLEATVNDDAATVTNSYKADSITTGEGENAPANLQVTKEVKGNSTDAAFSFTTTLTSDNAANVLTDADDPNSTLPTDGITKETKAGFTDGQTKTVDFGSLTFTAEGDYTFKVVETGVAPANWTYATGDDNAKTITIHVTDPDNGGQLVASYDKDAANNPTFTNSYKADGTLDGDAEGAKNLMVTKTIDGRKFQKDDTFSFQLTADKNNPAGATLPKNADDLTIAYADGDDTNSKTAAFGDIKFTLPGTYTFHVSEKVPADADKLGGMTYSDEQYTVTVEVTDAQDGGGKLDAAITKIVNKAGAEVDGLAFTNTYKPGGTTDLPETGNGSIQLRKVLTGKAWDGDEFKFQLTAKGATTPDGSEIADVPMPDVAEKTISDKTGTENGNDYADFGFGPIIYSQAGTYVYEVTEVPGDNAGISYDGHTATVTVSVVDNLHGGFTATASVANGTFTNVYKSELDYQAAGGLEIAKTFENADMREFSFTVKPADQASADKLGIKLDGETLTTTPGATIGDDNASHATISIGAGTDVTFTQADAGKTYTYTVQENAGSDAGVNYDGTVYTVTITTVDDGKGGIQVTTTVTDAAGNTQSYVYDNDDTTENKPAVIPFTNTYTATGELGGNGSTSIEATKTLTNRPMTDGEFTFNVTNAADQNNTVVATGTNAADGTVTFSPISYSAGQMFTDATNGLAQKSVVDGKNTFTYQYTVAEDQASFDEGVTAIADSFQITVTVTDNGDGTLGIAVAYPDGGDDLTFRNAYGEGEQGQATLNIAGEKKLAVQSGNNVPDIEGKYTFELTGSEGAPMPGKTTATNDAAGNVIFGDITYTMENVFGDTGSASADEGVATQSAQRTKTFTYTVTEAGAVAGVANDPEASKTFTVTVTDNGDGTLSAMSDPAQGAKFSFTNTYSVKPTDSSATGKGGITVTKKFTGRDLQDGEFSFELVDHNGQKVAEGTNDADGNVELGAVTFTEPGVYHYTIREVNTALASVDYDAAEHAVTATVTDNGDGTLSVTWKLDGDAPATFTNTYDPVDASVVIGASKVLDGRELKDGEFTFQLTGADESTPMPEDAKDGVATATNAANGSIGFGTIVYDQAGTYKYTVSEVNDKQDGVTYDDTTYEVTVTVTDNTAEGRLEATVDYGDATALVFTNTYKKAEATIPKTGAAVILPSVIGFILLLGAGGMYASKRRKRS